MPSPGCCCGQVAEVLAPLPGVLGHPTPFSGGRSPFAPNDHWLPSAKPCGLVSADSRLKSAGVVDFLASDTDNEWRRHIYRLAR